MDALANFYRQFATMLDAGLPLSRCLDALSKQSPGRLSRAASQMRQRIDSGWTLTEAAEELPRVFSPLRVNLIRAGETSGNLEGVFLKMADAQESSSRLRKQVIGKLIYPVILLHVGVVVPSVITGFFQDARAAVLQALTILVPAYLLVIFLVLIRRFGKATEPSRHFLDAILYHLPVIGGVVQKVGLARFARTFESLYSAGVGLPRALVCSAEATGNTVMERRIKRAEEAVRDGEDLAVALAGTRAFSPIVNNMIATGVESGKLDSILVKLTEHAEYEAQVSIERMAKVIPGLLYACLVIWIAMQIITIANQYVGALNQFIP